MTRYIKITHVIRYYTIGAIIAFLWLLFKHVFIPSKSGIPCPEQSIPIGIVASDERLDQALRLIKSITLTSNCRKDIHIFTSEESKAKVREIVRAWPRDVTARTTFRVRSASYPVEMQNNSWKTLYRPFASLRLFFPHMLTEIDSIIYIDSDALFLAPVETLWEKFRDFNESQIAAATVEDQTSEGGWYNNNATHPYFGDLGK